MDDHPPRSNLGQLVQEAQRLRDHLLHVEGQSTADLVAALQPFERDLPLDQVPDPEIRTLSEAFQAAYDNATDAVDAYTLSEVLRGNSPYFNRQSLWVSSTLAIIGALLVATALHFSLWSNRSMYDLNRAQAFIEFDHSGELTKLVELENYFDETMTAPTPPVLEPMLLYLEGKAKLEEHYTTEYTLPGELSIRMNETVPLHGVWQGLHNSTCGSADDPPWAPLGWLLHCAWAAVPDDTADETQPAVSQETVAEEAGERVEQQLSLFRTELSEVEQRQQATMAAAGRDSLQLPYVFSQLAVQQRMTDLESKLSSVNRLWLPITYGALGSIVYCMWRVLSAHVAALGFFYALLRTAFAALAALTLSMLLVPANVLNIGTDASRPLIYLISFIFGYSVEAFVATLNRLNSFVASSVTPKKNRTG